MACHHPIPATIDSDGTVTLKHTLSQALWEDGEYLELECKHCLACRAKRARGWAIRAHHENQMSTRWTEYGPVSNSAFLTLTYAEEPENGSLDHAHFQNFAKKVRRDLGSFRFLMCGEYGSSNGRPHYHALIFGQDWHRDRYPWKVQASGTLYRSPSLEEQWPHGFSLIGPVNFATASYVAQYMNKKQAAEELGEDLWNHVYGWEDGEPVYSRKPPYICMSRGGKKGKGLGHSWIEKHWTDVYPMDRVIIGTNRFTPPAYYDRWLEENHGDIWLTVQEQRKEHVEKMGPSSENALKARKANFLARKKMKPQRHSQV